MDSLRAHKSLKAYKYCYDGFIKNVSLHEFPPSENPLHFRVLYFHAFVHHSLSCDSPLEVFVSLNGDTGDVYAAKCNCVSGYAYGLSPLLHFFNLNKICKYQTFIAKLFLFQVHTSFVRPLKQP